LIKTYRGLLVSGGQDTIPLHTTDGKIGYRIVKFQTILETPGTVDAELVTKIYKTFQSNIGGEIDFTDNTLLAASYWQGGNISTETHAQTVVFDNEIFNQDIYVTAEDKAGSASTNYYIELEQIKLTENEALVAIVKDLREEQ